ncbi:MAG: hypothetical protein ACRCWR_06185 [Saezia sp.]
MIVIIDGVEYVPKIQDIPANDTSINRCIAQLVSIQYFYGCTSKHRAMAWDALNEMCSSDLESAYNTTRLDLE